MASPSVPTVCTLASASNDSTVKIWEADSGRELLTFRGHSSYVHGVAFSPDSKRVASSSTSGPVKIWDPQTGQEQLTLKGHTKVVWRVAFSPDGKRLASASVDKTAVIWDTSTGARLRLLLDILATCFVCPSVRTESGWPRAAPITRSKSGIPLQAARL